MKLTVRDTDRLELPPGKSDHIFFDDDIPGFGVRVRKGGSRSWVFQYRIGSKQRRMALGSISAVPLPLARENAGKLAARVRLGGDPARDKEIARHEAGDTFGALVARYLERRKPDLRPRSYAEVARHLTKYAKPLHGQPITAVSHRAISELLNKVGSESGNVTSNRVRASLSAFLGWVLREGIRLPEGNIASNTNKRDEKSRERVLSDAELKTIWNACLDDDYGRVLKLLMLTGQRANEIAGLRQDELGPEEIVLPGARTKNHRTHTIPLSEAAKAILEPLRNKDRMHVFGRDDTGFQGWNKAKERIEDRIAEGGSPLPRWTPHDFRRTAATGMANLGVAPHVIEAVLNHVSGHKAGVAGIYNRASYEKEKREALNLWAEHLMAVVEGRAAVVVPLKRA